MGKPESSETPHDKLQVLDETCFPVQEGARRINTKPSPELLLRWAKRGLTAANGEKIRLETCKSGGKVYTSLEAFKRFNAALVGRDMKEDEGA